MRVAILSDIHGNSVALESALRDLGSEPIDRFVCLGDVASDGPQPREVVAHLKALGGSVVQGHMDAWLLDAHPLGGKSENAQRGDEIRSWDVDQLSSNDLRYLSTFQSTLEISLNGTGEVLCYHGSPRSCEEAIRSTTPDDELEKCCPVPALRSSPEDIRIYRWFAVLEREPYSTQAVSVLLLPWPARIPNPRGQSTELFPLMMVFSASSYVVWRWMSTR